MRDRQAPPEREAVAQSFVANAKELLSLSVTHTHTLRGLGGLQEPMRHTGPGQCSA